MIGSELVTTGCVVFILEEGGAKSLADDAETELARELRAASGDCRAVAVRGMPSMPATLLS